MNDHSIVVLLVRAFVYMLAAAGLTYLIMLEGYERGAQSAYSERSLTEWLEMLLSLASGVLFLVSARLQPALRPALAMLAALCLMMCVREGDFLLDEYVFDGAWQTLVTAIIVVTAIYVWRQPLPVKPAILDFARLPAAGILLSGFMVLFVFSRLFGRESFWQVVMGDTYMRVVKNIAEEGTEIMGYGLIAISAAELLFTILRGRFARANAP